MIRRNTIGFRHIIEGTIRILQGDPIDKSRQKYILAAMKRFLDQAEKGSGFIHERAWVVPPSGSEALGSYTFVDSHLRGSKDLDQTIAIAKEAIELKEMNNRIPVDKAASTLNLLSNLLESMKTERRNHSEEPWGTPIAIIGS